MSHPWKNKVIWLFGLSGVGKTTLGKKLVNYLSNNGGNSILLDGDDLRSGLNKDLGFDKEGRVENIRRLAEIAKFLIKSNLIPVVCAITPYDINREHVKDIIGEDKIIFVYVKCALNICEQRDVKGLYAKARSGVLNNFTGIGDKFQEPNCSLTIETSKNEIDLSFTELLNFLENENS